MLKIFLFAFILFLLAFFGMALGYIVKRKSIQGSCGGLGSIGIEKECDCPEPCDARKKEWRKKLLAKSYCRKTASYSLVIDAFFC